MKPKRRRRLVRLPEPKTTPEEFRSDFYHALVQAQGESSIWRPLDDIEIADAARALGFGEEEE